MLLLLSALACAPAEVDSASPPPDMPEATPAPASLRRLTRAQLHHALRDLFGDDILLPTRLEPDEPVDGLVAVGMAETTLSARGVEQMEEAAFSVAEQVVALPEVRDAWLPCVPEATDDADCLAAFIDGLGLRAWRRPLTAEELDRITAVAVTAATTLDDFDAGLVYAMAALMQSPHFLYRVEVGTPTGDGLRRLDDYELASRLSFFFWDTLPDEELLALAAEGTLSDPVELRAQAERLLDDPRAHEGVRAFFTDMLQLYELDELSKDPLIFPHYSQAVGPAAREETLLGIEHIVFTEDGDLRDLLTTRRTFIDHKLASIYEVPAPAREGFDEVILPHDGGRAGLLGQVSFLAAAAHPVSSSATLRGAFVREVLLCQDIPPPPGDVDASIPEPSADAPTLRERVAIHLEVDTCASCHQLTDPIGLGLENFDGLGRWRDTENGATIDPSGELDGVWFADARELGRAVRSHPDFTPCVVDTLYRWGLGHPVSPEEEAMVDYLSWSFSDADHSMRSLMLELVQNPHFLYVAEPE
ncbi:MAG: DUF1592 domain-containing protein [Alphaproteobacteria bacterium]|nr:DUF1592 domain-containing protein [Alphaproteobacteria bacterium]